MANQSTTPTRNYTAKENAKKCLDIILKYSKTVKKNKEYIAHPQSMLKDDLKREFGCKTDDADGRDRRMTGKIMGNDESIPSIKSKEINDFIEKYICYDSLNQSSNTNIITLNHDEFIRLKAGGSAMSKPDDNDNENNRTNRKSMKRQVIVESCSGGQIKLKNTQVEVGTQNNNGFSLQSNNKDNEKFVPCNVQSFDKDNNQMQELKMNKYRDMNEMSLAINRKEMKDSYTEGKMDQLSRRKTSLLRMKSPNNSESASNKHISFATKNELFEISSDKLKSDYSTGVNDREGSSQRRGTKTKLTIVEFDNIFNTELKKRRGRVSNANAAQSGLRHNPCSTSHIHLEPTSTVKTTLIHSAVTGLPNDILFNEDYELMNAIDKFIQAENACKFEEALRAAEIAAKLAPPGYEEEAAASAARNYQFQCDKLENFNTIQIDKKKKPIEIISYVGSTNNNK
ncbi:hypothetical protein M8J76_002569 [Diaphorina citri]|nr:hypothetical protein M8J75_003807 [Diaphorina citri]KAI5744475.1 hypothetical protein M8J76_002569 [Diaphorina citri]